MRPTAGQRQTLALTRVCIDAVASLGTQVRRHELPDTLAHAASLNAKRFSSRTSIRTVPHYAAGFAARYCFGFILGPQWSYIARDVQRLAAKLDGPEALAQDAFSGQVPRLAWAEPGEGRVVLDEIHLTHLRGGLIDDWMRPRLVADLLLGQRVWGERFAGVRVVAVRRPERSLLIRSIGDLDLQPLLSASELAAIGGWWR